MNKNITMIFTFIAGVAVGVAATYKIAETKYQNIADEEIESVKATFSKHDQKNAIDVPASPVLAVERKIITKPDILDYKSKIERVGYDTISKQTSKKEEEVPVVPDSNEEDFDGYIYSIPPDEFNILDDYNTTTFYYSSDNYLLDSDYKILDDADIRETIGRDPFGMFGEYEDDSVHIRNELKKIDYEILLSEKTCAEIQEE